jgi:hypothetical protein
MPMRQRGLVLKTDEFLRKLICLFIATPFFADIV